jgi:hypothetical protein
VDWWLVILVIAIILASRPIEARLWRAGRLSDHQVTALVIGRFPAIVGLFAVFAGASLPMIVLLVGVALVPSLLFYRFALGVVRENAPTPRP